MRKIRYISAVACLSLAVACHQPSEKENSDNELTVNGGKKGVPDAGGQLCGADRRGY